MKYLEDIYMETAFLENYLFPQQVVPQEETVSSEEETIENEIHHIKRNLLNIFRGLDTVKNSSEQYGDIVDAIKDQLRPVLRKMQMRLTIDKPTGNLTPLEVKSKIAIIQGLFSSTLLALSQLKAVYEKHKHEKMLGTLNDVENLIETPFQSFSQYVFEPLKMHSSN